MCLHVFRLQFVLEFSTEKFQKILNKTRQNKDVYLPGLFYLYKAFVN